MGFLVLTPAVCVDPSPVPSGVWQPRTSVSLGHILGSEENSCGCRIPGQRHPHHLRVRHRGPEGSQGVPGRAGPHTLGCSTLGRRPTTHVASFCILAPGSPGGPQFGERPRFSLFFLRTHLGSLPSPERVLNLTEI